jgi:hypothetical protein
MPRSWFDFRIFIRVSNRIFLEFFVRFSSCSRIKPFDFRASTVLLHSTQSLITLRKLSSDADSGTDNRNMSGERFLLSVKFVKCFSSYFLRGNSVKFI